MRDDAGDSEAKVSDRIPNSPLSDEETDELVRELQRQWASGSPPSALLRLLTTRGLRGAQVITFMQGAFELPFSRGSAIAGWLRDGDDERIDRYLTPWMPLRPGEAPNQDHETDVLLRKLFEWWLIRGSTDPLEFLHAGFTYRGASADLDSQGWVSWVRQSPSWRGGRVLVRLIQGDRAALAYEGTDCATGLRHRIGWFVLVRDGRVFSLLETSATVESPRGPD